MLRAIAAALLAAAFLVGVPQIALADESGGGSIIDYENVGGENEEQIGDSGNSAGGNAPACQFQGQYQDLCVGTSACWINDPAEVQEPKALEGVERPSPEDHVIYISCITPSGEQWDRWYWSSQWETESIVDRMWTARGQLDIPGFTAQFNPPTRSIVNLQTWFAAPGMPADEVVGSSAAGLVAIASPQGMSVDPGDGTGTLTCPISSTPADTCAHVYRKAREAGYTATVAVNYDIRYEQGGQVIAIPPGAPAGLRQIQVADDVPVPVLEVQSIVTEVD